MAQIYEGFALNISALSSSDCDSGMLTKLPDIGLPFAEHWHPARRGHGDTFVRQLNDTVEKKDNYLSTRRWAFQKALSDVARLHYLEAGMSWECASEYFAKSSRENNKCSGSMTRK